MAFDAIKCSCGVWQVFIYRQSQGDINAMAFGDWDDWIESPETQVNLGSRVRWSLDPCAASSKLRCSTSLPNPAWPSRLPESRHLAQALAQGLWYRRTPRYCSLLIDERAFNLFFVLFCVDIVPLRNPAAIRQGVESEGRAGLSHLGVREVPEGVRVGKRGESWLSLNPAVSSPSPES